MYETSKSYGTNASSAEESLRRRKKMLMRKRKKRGEEAIECRTFLVTQKMKFLAKF